MAFPPLSVTVPIVAVPFLKTTVPVGAGFPGKLAATVVVKVTDCPTLGTLLLLVNTTRVPPWL